MTASDVLLDTWAWWEILGSTPHGEQLRDRYLDRKGLRVYTSTISLGELSAKLASIGEERRIGLMASSLRAHSELMDVTPEIALRAGVLRKKLRTDEPQASLADAIVMATAIQCKARVISDDPAFRNQANLR